MAKVTRMFTLRKRQALEIGPIKIRITGASPKAVREIELRITTSPSLARKISRLKDRSDLDKSE